jgi:hypothetical protein
MPHAINPTADTITANGDHKTQACQSASVENVFGFPHLAEKILLHMRIKDLLVNAQRVSKQWKAVIDSSTRLQQALFFKPLPGGPIHMGDRLLSRLGGGCRLQLRAHAQLHLRMQVLRL